MPCIWGIAWKAIITGWAATCCRWAVSRELMACFKVRSSSFTAESLRSSSLFCAVSSFVWLSMSFETPSIRAFCFSKRLSLLVFTMPSMESKALIISSFEFIRASAFSFERLMVTLASAFCALIISSAGMVPPDCISSRRSVSSSKDLRRTRYEAFWAL